MVKEKRKKGEGLVMLTLIGLGLNDERDLTLRGIEAAKEADKVYYELYTGKWLGSVESLQKILGKEQVFPLRRQDLEEGSARILEEAKGKKIAILIQGDPMVATTHSSLLMDARSLGIETGVVHNSSIFSAVAETGLHVYKFGATVTIPFLEKTGGKFSKSVYDTIKDNKKAGLHTLCLLDVGVDGGTFMTPRRATGLLMGMERQFGEGVIESYQKIIVFSRAGGDSKIFYGEIETLSEGLDLTPSVLIVPGKLHFTEEEFLEKFGSK